jgi:hypothetical protein
VRHDHNVRRVVRPDFVFAKVAYWREAWRVREDGVGLRFSHVLQTSKIRQPHRAVDPIGLRSHCRAPPRHTHRDRTVRRDCSIVHIRRKCAADRGRLHNLRGALRATAVAPHRDRVGPGGLLAGSARRGHRNHADRVGVRLGGRRDHCAGLGPAGTRGRVRGDSNCATLHALKGLHLRHPLPHRRGAHHRMRRMRNGHAPRRELWRLGLHPSGAHPARPCLPRRSAAALRTADGPARANASAQARLGGAAGACEATEWISDSSLLCAFASQINFFGELQPVGAAVTIMERVATVTGPYTYTAAEVTAATPQNTRNAGGTVVSVHGARFGIGFNIFVGMDLGVTDSTVRARAGGSACEASSWRSDTALICTVPRGSGRTHGLVATVAVSRATLLDVFSYAAAEVPVPRCGGAGRAGPPEPIAPPSSWVRACMHLLTQRAPPA